MDLTFNKEKNPKDTANVNTTAQAVTCPRCGRGGCDRIRRGAVVKMLLPWLKLKRYQCHGCMRRFYKIKN